MPSPRARATFTVESRGADATRIDPGASVPRVHRAHPASPRRCAEPPSLTPHAVPVRTDPHQAAPPAVSPIPNPFAFRRRVPGRGAIRAIWWDFCAFCCWAYLAGFLGLRRHHRERVPATGGVLVVSNHQSFLDPMVNGVTVWERQFTALARDTLFKGPFGWLIRSVSARPIRREGGDVEAMKAALAELEAGRVVILYPEGTRSPDGERQAFRRGVLLLVKRARATVLPMGVEGTFDAWPKGRKLPRLFGKIDCVCGEPIDGAALAAMTAEEQLRTLEAAVARAHDEARAIHRRRTGREPRA